MYSFGNVSSEVKINMRIKHMAFRRGVYSEPVKTCDVMLCSISKHFRRVEKHTGFCEPRSPRDTSTPTHSSLSRRASPRLIGVIDF